MAVGIGPHDDYARVVASIIKANEPTATAEERQVLRAGYGGGRPRRPWRCDRRSCWRARGAAANRRVAEDLGVSRATAMKWWSRSAADGLEGLSGESPPGAPRHDSTGLHV